MEVPRRKVASQLHLKLEERIINIIKSPQQPGDGSISVEFHHLNGGHEYSINSYMCSENLPSSSFASSSAPENSDDT